MNEADNRIANLTRQLEAVYESARDLGCRFHAERDLKNGSVVHRFVLSVKIPASDQPAAHGLVVQKS